MHLIILTGMSGAGKSKALDVIEDIGYYCVDNMPPQLIPKFVEICTQSGGKLEKVAIGADIRNMDNFDELISRIKDLKDSVDDCKVFFMDCSTDVLVKRFKETRRRHPLADRVSGGLPEMIVEERKILTPLYNLADYIIDTSSTTIGQAWSIIVGYIMGTERNLEVQIVSFGFKNGLPADCDFVFDTRALPNPFYVDELRNMTGRDKEVYDYIFSFRESQDYYDKICRMMESLMPLFVKEGKATLTVGIGCTGGRHRSVAFADRLKEFFERCGKKTTVIHRELK